jgi:release factor glutamine methyltransferase
MTISQIRKKAADDLSKIYHDTEAEIITEWVLEEVLGWTHLELVMRNSLKLKASQLKSIQQMIARLLRHEPVQYVFEKAFFLDLELKVGPGVLIPRRETEELVMWVVGDMENRSPLHILDLGTGSGCIAIALKKYLPRATVEAWENAPAAFEMAKYNIELNPVDVKLFRKDIFEVTSESAAFDVMVSNPPYVLPSDKNAMDKKVIDYEPHEALFVDEIDPIRFYRRMALMGLSMLKPYGTLYFEIHEKMGQNIKEMLQAEGYRNVKVRKDMQGKDRMVRALRPD